MVCTHDFENLTLDTNTFTTPSTPTTPITPTTPTTPITPTIHSLPIFTLESENDQTQAGTPHEDSMPPSLTENLDPLPRTVMCDTVARRLGVGSTLYDVLGMPIYSESTWLDEQPYFSASASASEFGWHSMNDKTFSMLLPEDTCLANIRIINSLCYVFPERQQRDDGDATAAGPHCFLLRQPYADAITSIFPTRSTLRTLVYRKSTPHNTTVPAPSVIGVFDIIMHDQDIPLELRQHMLWQYTDALRQYNETRPSHLDIHWVGHWSCCKNIDSASFQIGFDIAGHAALHLDSTVKLTQITE